MLTDDLKAILVSESFEFLMCKCSPFEETRFVTSSVAGNHVTVYVSGLKQTCSYEL